MSPKTAVVSSFSLYPCFPAVLVKGWRQARVLLSAKGDLKISKFSFSQSYLKDYLKIFRIYSTDFRYNVSITYDSFYSLPFASPPLGINVKTNMKERYKCVLCAEGIIYQLRNSIYTITNLGKDRFARPKPPMSWTDPRNATKEGAPVPFDRDCYQVGNDW